jgi:hypothetical protein
MTPHLCPLACCAGLFVFALLGMAAPAREYSIRINRPLKAGDTFMLFARGTSNVTRIATVAQNAPIRQDLKTEIVLEGTMKVLEVSSIGAATRSECMVIQCILNGNPICKAGEVIKAEFADGVKRYVVNGVIVDDATAQALATVMPCANPASSLTEDMLFGTDTQKVGDSWPAHPAAVADSAAEDHLTVNSEKVRGSSKLVSVKQIDGKDVLLLEMDATLEGARPPLPPDSVVGESVMTIRMSDLVPADSTSQPLSKSKTSNAEFHATMPAPNNQKAHLDMGMTEVTESAITQSKAAP